MCDQHFYYLHDFVRLRISHVKFLASLPGIVKIDIVKKIVLFDLDVLFNFCFIVLIVVGWTEGKKKKIHL